MKIKRTLLITSMGLPLVFGGLVALSGNEKNRIEPVKAAVAFDGGDGSKENPYLISTSEQMWKFHDIIEGDNGETANNKACAKLTSSIDLGCSSENSWNPIGRGNGIDGDHVFKGVFDGDGYEIGGYYLNTGTFAAGLFGFVSEHAEIKNFTLRGYLDMNGPAADYRGGVVAYLARGSKVINVHSFVEMYGSHRFTYVGGVVGYAADPYNWGSPVISRCSYHSQATLIYNDNYNSYSNWMGGIAGYIQKAEISDCYFNGRVEFAGTGAALQTGFVGGIIGSGVNSESAVLKRNFNYGVLVSPLDSRIGGISGDGLNGAVLSDNFYLKNDEYKGLGQKDAESKDVDGMQSLTVDQFKDKTSFTNYDFTNVWKMGNMYPKFHDDTGATIAGTPISSVHSSGEGWSYDFETSTLTLNNFTFDGDGTVGAYDDYYNSVIHLIADDNLNIVLVGSNSIYNHAVQSYTAGILSTGNVNISGSGSLDMKTEGANGRNFGIDALGSVTISNATITMDIEASLDGFCTGIRSEGKITINSGSVCIVAGDADASETIGLWPGDQGVEIKNETKKVELCGSFVAIYGDLKTEIGGSGYYDFDGATSKKTMEAGSYSMYDLDMYMNIKLIGVTLEDVIALIDAIGEVEYSTESKAKIDAARSGYNALSDNDKELVTNYAVLEEAESEYAALKHNHDLADAVVALIEAIGTVEETEECATKIEAAREAYDALENNEQRALVSNYEDLENAEDEYKYLHDPTVAKELIDSIGDVEDTKECGDKIHAAREAYDALDDVQKARVDNVEILEAAEEEYNYIHAPTAVRELIDAIGEVTLEKEDKINAAKTAFDALDNDQKALVSNIDVLDAAITQLALLKHQDDVQDNGVKVTGKDGALIPMNVNLKVELQSEVKARQGSTEYNKISSMLGGNGKISAVFDVKLIKTEGGVQTEIQPSDIKEGMIIIIEITLPDGLNVEGLRVLHIHSEEDIAFVNNFTINGNKLVFETDKLSEIAFVTTVKAKLPGWAIALIVIGAILVTCCLAYFLLLFVFNKWVRDEKDEDKAHRVFPFAFGEKDGKKRLYSFPWKFYYRVKEEIYKSKKDALKDNKDN